MSRTLTAALALSVAFSAPAVALEPTHADRLDGRILEVPYEADNVVPLKTTMGTGMMVRFAPDENIVQVADSDTQRLIAKIYHDYMFLKPIRIKGDPPNYVLPRMPIFVLTEKHGEIRHYQFEFDAQAAGGDPNYTVLMTYPHDAYLKRRAEERAREKRAEQAETQALLNEETEFQRGEVNPYDGTRNYRYVARGDRALAPSWVWDNGHSTVLIYSGMQRMPALFKIDPDGKEATADFTVHGDAIIAPGTAPEWRLRDGHTVLEIYDLSYNPVGATPDTGTVSPQVQRALRDAGNGR
jgi:type IV secretion system protein VirB9